jgi:serine/threonine protein phosphatase PrpC
MPRSRDGVLVAEAGRLRIVRPTTGPLVQITVTPRLDQTLPTLGSPSRTEPPAIEFAARTDVGKKRERNEDQYVVAHLGRWVGIEATSLGSARELTSRQGTLMVVADGMGGHGGGDVASAVALDSFLGHSLLDMPWLGSGSPDGDALLTADVERFLVDCQARLLEVAERKQLPSNLGTTLTIAYLTGPRLILVHVGDTRAYLLRAGNLRCLSHDHTLGAAIGPDANGKPSPLSHVLANAIGGNRDRPRPELSAMALERGDRILLCSDGLHGPVDDVHIASILGGAMSAQAAVDGLIEAALANGGPDNVTAVVAFG